MTAIWPSGQAPWKRWHMSYKHRRFGGAFEQTRMGCTWISLYQPRPLEERERNKGLLTPLLPHSILLQGPNFKAFNGNQPFPSVQLAFLPPKIALHFSLLSSIPFVTSSPIYQFWFTSSIFAPTEKKQPTFGVPNLLDKGQASINSRILLRELKCSHGIRHAVTPTFILENITFGKWEAFQSILLPWNIS